MLSKLLIAHIDVTTFIVYVSVNLFGRHVHFKYTLEMSKLSFIIYFALTFEIENRKQFYISSLYMM